MNILEQTNPMSGVEVRGLKIVSYAIEGEYENIDIAIKAYAEDQFVCEKYPFLNSPGGAEEFSEVWSFIRRKDHKGNGDIYHSLSCPKCGGDLTNKLQANARCAYCGVYLNSGEFDWVLSEITQVADYGDSSPSTFFPRAHAPERYCCVARNIFPAFSTHVFRRPREQCLHANFNCTGD